jgi:curved DNA-binding protein CbpA
MDDRCFWEILGLKPGASRGAVKQAYRRLARRHHPDFYPAGEKPLQELKMISLNEAYAHLLRSSAQRVEEDGLDGQADSPMQACRAGTAAQGAQGVQGVQGAADSRPADPAAEPAGMGPGQAESLGPHREPAYAYYKQGFIHYSLAIHGIQALYRSFRRPHPVHFDPLDDAYERFAGSLTELRLAHEYFQRVAGEHAESVWAPDARVKLARIARFSELYRRILRNLRARAG